MIASVPIASMTPTEMSGAPPRGEIDHRGARAVGEVAVAVGDEAMRRARAVAGADVEIDAVILVVALVLAEREAGMRAVIHPVETQADVVIGVRGARKVRRAPERSAPAMKPVLIAISALPLCLNSLANDPPDQSGQAAGARSTVSRLCRAAPSSRGTPVCLHHLQRLRRGSARARRASAAGSGSTAARSAPCTACRDSRRRWCSCARSRSTGGRRHRLFDQHAGDLGVVLRLDLVDRA